MTISVVIPTCNRKHRLMGLLQALQLCRQPLLEVIVVDAGENRLSPQELAVFSSLPLQYLTSDKSVCIQRNKGIRLAKGEWIFLCDDDMEVPPDYLEKLMAYSARHPGVGALSGSVLQKEGIVWKADYPETSVKQLCWKYLFRLSIWGTIDCPGSRWPVNRIKAYYQRKGNFVSAAGWPVITDCAGERFVTPVYGLGASLVKRSWLLQSPYEEVLDRHGIGDNYGVAMGFPVKGIHVLREAVVYHHQEPLNRLQRPVQYCRRVWALDYFRRTKTALQPVKKHWLLWSLMGNLLAFIYTGDTVMIKPAFRQLCKMAWGKNPYYQAALAGKKVTEPAI